MEDDRKMFREETINNLCEEITTNIKSLLEKAKSTIAKAETSLL